MLFRSLALFAALFAAAAAAATPPRDYDANHYFVVDIDTLQSPAALDRFVDLHRGTFTLEHQVAGLDDHYVFSVRKNHSISAIMGDWAGVPRALGALGRLLQRRAGFEAQYDLMVGGVRSVELMEPRRLQRRLPVPHERDAGGASGGARGGGALGQVARDDANAAPGAAPGAAPVAPGPPAAVDSLQQATLDVMRDLAINDPIFAQQWHLINTNYPGNDVNVTGLWREGVTGGGIVAAVIDDGLDYESPDLKDNFNAAGLWDFNENTALPFPRLYDDYHGTRCAGEIGAVKNDVCGVGVAYGGQVAGIRILLGPITLDQEALAMMYGLDVNDIYLCLWGPTDDGKTLSQPLLVVKKAIIKLVQQGRRQKGSIYVFASGNGGRAMDLCNFDGYTNLIYSITVGAIDHRGLHPVYLEACSAVMVVTYLLGSGEHIHTTDVKQRCLAGHGGTSAAAPLAAGIFQLVLLMNPQLTWRDLQWLCALNAVPVNLNDGAYQKTALGRHYLHKYGYGKLDAWALGHAARAWTNVKPQLWFYSDVVTVAASLDGDVDGLKVLSKLVTVTEDDLATVNLERVEHVTVTVNIGASFRGKVGARLVLPLGVVSDLATFRPGDMSGSGFVDWTFMLVAHWGERGVGDWKMEVFSSQPAEGVQIDFKDFQLKLFGELADADKAETYDITRDYASERRDRQREKGDVAVNHPSAVPEATTTFAAPESVVESAAASAVASATGSAVASATESAVALAPAAASTSNSALESAAPASETATPTPHDDDEDGKTKHYTSDHRGQYFMALAVIGFLVVILFMRFHKSPASSRRRRRREEYEFDIIPGEDYTDSEDDGDLLDLGRGGRNDRRTSDEERDRLYDEFNAETLPEYEEEMFKIGDEDDENAKPDTRAEPPAPQAPPAPASEDGEGSSAELSHDAKNAA